MEGGPGLGGRALIEQARAEGVNMFGPGSPLAALTEQAGPSNAPWRASWMSTWLTSTANRTGRPTLSAVSGRSRPMKTGRPQWGTRPCRHRSRRGSVRRSRVDTSGIVVNKARSRQIGGAVRVVVGVGEASIGPLGRPPPSERCVAVDQVQVDLGQEAVVGEAARQRLPQRLWSSSPSMVA